MPCWARLSRHLRHELHAAQLHDPLRVEGVGSLTIPQQIDMTLRIPLEGLGRPEFVTQYSNGDRVSYLQIVFEAVPTGGLLRADADETLEFRYFTPDEIGSLPVPGWLPEVLSGAAYRQPTWSPLAADQRTFDLAPSRACPCPLGSTPSSGRARSTHNETWMEGQGLVAAGAPWESYVTDPTTVPDPKDWKTEVFWPVQ